MQLPSVLGHFWLQIFRPYPFGSLMPLFSTEDFLNRFFHLLSSIHWSLMTFWDRPRKNSVCSLWALDFKARHLASKLWNFPKSELKSLNNPYCIQGTLYLTHSGELTIEFESRGIFQQDKRELLDSHYIE